jgi:hypothetical protein
MALSGPRAQALLSEVMSLIRPHLPADVRVEMLAHKKWTTLAQNTPNGGYALTVRGIGPWPFLPPRMRARLAAQQAVETVLEVAYWVPDKGRSDQQDFDVRAVITSDEVSVSYRPPGADARIELTPIPLSRL